MNDLSLYVLDIVQNSIKAKSKNIKIEIKELIKENLLIINIIDDGCGMDEKVLKKVEDPFYTTRTTRKVGLGIPLFKEICLLADGSFKITSKVNEGTTINAVMQYNHVDRLPTGDMGETLYSIIICIDDTDIVFTYQINDNIFTFDTKQIKEILNGISLKENDVLLWIKEYIQEGLKEIKLGGK